jgi:hypothetical protein
MYRERSREIVGSKYVAEKLSEARRGRENN